MVMSFGISATSRWNPRERRPAAALRRRRLVLTVAASMAAWASAAAAQSPPPGGFLELTTTAAVRPRVTPTLPPRGAFTFPAPYNTAGIRLTNSADCGGSDCVDYIGYSYWRNMNNHVGSDTML